MKKTKIKTKSRATPKDKPTLICFLLDRTGSMEDIRDETIKGFNGYIEEVKKKLPDTARFTMMQFDTISMDMLYERAKLDEVEPLTQRTYVPRGGTPLYDAMGKLIHVTREKTIGSHNAGRDFKVLFVSLTDGEENSSSEWTLEKVKSLIKEMEDSYKWTFAHIGTDMQGWEAGHTMYAGTQSHSNVASVSKKNMHKAFRSMAMATVNYSSSAAGGQCVNSAVWGKPDMNLDEDDTPEKKS